MTSPIDHNHRSDPASPAALWENARGCWEAFALLFGAPLQLLGEVFIRRSERNEANAFLRSLEALVRRLLLTEAIQLLPRTREVAEGRRGTTVETFPNTTIRPPPVLPRSGEEPSLPDPAKTSSVIPGEGAKRRRPGTQSVNQRDPLGSGSPRPHPEPVEGRCCRNENTGDAELDTESTARWPAHFALRLNILLGANFAEPRAAPPPPNRAAPSAHLHDPAPEPADHLPIFDFAEPTALRVEALRRVIADPDAYIRRTARALAAFRRRNRPPILLPVPHIAGDNQRFFHTPLIRIAASAASALDQLWPDTS